MVALFALIMFGVFARQTAQGQQALVGQASVIDGDTIEIHGQRIRLWGIDAPESRQQCTTAAGTLEPAGRRAANRLDAIIGDHVVACADRGRDRYGRVIGSCEASGADISQRMVQEGLAWADVQYSSDYVADETIARNDREGVWSMSCEARWDWRRQRRAR
jgi:endonuclease YncB( thermonuclease family)